MKRQIILDTETTGLSPAKGDRIVEIACLEMIDRELTGEQFHTYLQPYRLMPEHAYAIHGLSDEFLADKPRFKDIGLELNEFLYDSELIIHNAVFDMSFLIHEFSLLPFGYFTGHIDCLKDLNVICTKKMARRYYPTESAKLDDLCDKFGINRENRTLHGALIDCQLLAEVYLKMTEEEI